MLRFVRAPRNLVGYYSSPPRQKITIPTQQKTLSLRQQKQKANLVAFIRRGRDRRTPTDQQPNE